MNTDKLVRIGIASFGCGLLFANLINIISIALHGWDELDDWRVPVHIIPGLMVGAMLVAGAKAGRTADRRFVGVCTVLAGAVLAWNGALPEMAHALGLNFGSSIYIMLIFGPVGTTLGVLLFAVGVAVFLRDRLAGLCVMMPGIGSLPLAPYFAIDFLPLETSIEVRRMMHDGIYDAAFWHGVEATGAAMVVTGLATMWMAGRAKQGRAPEAA